MQRASFYIMSITYLLLTGCSHQPLFDKVVVSQTNLQPSENIKFLKLVFLLDVGGPGGAEGIWIFNSTE